MKVNLHERAVEKAVAAAANTATAPETWKGRERAFWRTVLQWRVKALQRGMVASLTDALYPVGFTPMGRTRR
jgi:hypothetical protein